MNNYIISKGSRILTIKEFYNKGFQLIERTKIIKTNEWQLDNDYHVDAVVPDAFSTTEKNILRNH